MKPNIVLLSDHTEVLFMQKTLGVYKVANELRIAGFDVQVISHLHVLSVDEIKQLLAKFVNEQTLFVGFSTFFYMLTENPISLDNSVAHQSGGTTYRAKQAGSMLPHGLAYNKIIKDHIADLNPVCKTVFGGPDACDAAYAKDYDYVVIGYADNSIVNLAKHLGMGEQLKNSYRSIYGPTIIDDRTADGYDFASTMMQYQSNDIVFPGETLSIEISRGCVFRCSFCAYPLNGKKKNDHIKLEEILYQEFLTNYNKFGVTRYIFVDDTFNDSPDKVRMVHRISKRLPFQLEYWAYIRLDLLASHPDTIPLLFESGCRACQFGIETMDPTASKAIGKSGNRKKHIDTLKQIKETYGDEVMLHGSFIFGLPGETLASMKQTGEQLINKEIALDSWFINPLSLTPERNFISELEKNYTKYGYSVEKIVEGSIIWRNEHTSYFECKALAKEIMLAGDLTGNKKITGGQTFYIAGLGFDLSYARNKSIKDFNWHSVDLKKQQRIAEYKSALKNLLAT